MDRDCATCHQGDQEYIWDAQRTLSHLRIVKMLAGQFVECGNCACTVGAFIMLKDSNKLQMEQSPSNGLLNSGKELVRYVLLLNESIGPSLQHLLPGIGGGNGGNSNDGCLG